MKRRFIIVVILFVIGILHGFAYDFEVDGIYYKKDAGGETVSVTWKTYKDGKIYSGDVIVPNKVTYNGKEYTVTGIDEYAFFECKITSVSLPNTITHIDKLAFYGCGLTSISLPSRLVSIGENAFGMCKIASFELPNTVETIGKYAFIQNTDLATINIPSSVTEIGGDAFRGCTNLSLTLLATDIAVSEGAFYRVKEVHITNIDSWMRIASTNRVFTYVDTGSYSTGLPQTEWSPVYYENNLVTDYVIPEGITTIGEKHFFNNTDITSLKTPQSLKKIDDCAFSGCSNITTLELGGVEDIGPRAFRSNKSLETVKFGSSIKTIQKDAFRDCPKISSVDIGDLANWCEVSFQWGNPYSANDPASGIQDDGTVNSNPLRYSHVIVVNGQQLDELIIPSGVTTISDCAFAGCLYFDKVVVPKTVKSIGMYAFANCSHVDNLTFANGSTLESIGDFAFKGCAFSSVSLPNTLLTLGSAFMNCHQLKTINIPTGVTAIADKTFYGCSSLEGIVIPDGVKTIGSGAFRKCNNEKFTSIAIPSSVETIGSEAFEGCNKLTGVYITDLAAWCNIDFIFATAYELDDYYTGFHVPGNPLYHAHKLYLNNELITDLVIPNSVKNVKQYTFIENTALNSITIPEGVETIGVGAFIRSINVNKVYLPSTMTDIGERAFERMLTATTNELHIKDLACWANNSLGSGFSLTGQINVYLNGKKIKNLVIPESVTIIPVKCITAGQGAFNRWGIETVTLPSTLQKMDGKAFSNCNGLKYIYSKAKFVPTLLNSSGNAQTKLDNLGSTLTTIYVPIGKSVSYKQSWSNHEAIIQETDTWPFEGIEYGDVSLDKTEAILEKGKTMTLKATVTPETLTDKSVTWQSSNTAVATVTSSGKVKGVKAGTATITCTFDPNGAKATCQVIVSYVKLDQTEVTLEKGKAMTLTSTVYPSKLTDQSVTWESSDTKIATVASDGTVMGVKAGTATITCTSVATGLSTTCKVTVNGVILNKSEAILEKGKTLTLKATVYPETLADKSVTWKSSNTAVATVSSAGKVKGVKAGTATITCTSVATGAKATCKVTVSYVKLDKSDAILEKGKTLTLKATVYPSKSTDQSVTWKSSNTAVATVSSAGKVKGVKAGTATITCTSKATGLSTTCTVTVSYVKFDKSEAILEKGKTLTLTPTVYPSKSTDQSVTWKSSNTTVATVASDGTVKGVKAGTATITCTSVATGLSTTCTVTVSYVKLDKSKVTIEKGKSITLTPTVYPSKSTDQSVTWKSSNTAVATVSSTGEVTGVKAGTATITCTSVATGLSTTCKVTVKASASARTIDGDDTELTDIEIVEETPAAEEPFDVYDLRGHKVRQGVTSLDGLPTGVYIVNGKKMLKK